MAIKIITLSNKLDYLPQAVASVKTQTRKCTHIILEDTGEWDGRYGPAVFYNEEAKKAKPGDYVAWLSDDDLLLPDYVEALAGALDEHPEWSAVYGRSLHIDYSLEHGWTTIRRPLPESPEMPIYTADRLPLGKIDGGQFMVRRSALDEIEYPYAPEEVNEWTRVSDGLLMNKLAVACGFYPVPRIIMLNRTTPISGHTRSEQ